MMWGVYKPFEFFLFIKLKCQRWFYLPSKVFFVKVILLQKTFYDLNEQENFKRKRLSIGYKI